MAKALNFDAIIPETIDVTKGGQTYHLRDDVPMTTLVRVFGLMELQASVRGKEVTAADAERWLGELQAKTLQICGGIFRHSLSAMTDDELSGLFSFEEQLQLVMLFFTTRSLQSRMQESGLSASSPAAMETTAMTGQAATASASAMGNRQTTERKRGTAAGTLPRRR